MHPAPANATAAAVNVVVEDALPPEVLPLTVDIKAWVMLVFTDMFNTRNASSYKPFTPSPKNVCKKLPPRDQVLAAVDPPVAIVDILGALNVGRIGSTGYGNGPSTKVNVDE